MRVNEQAGVRGFEVGLRDAKAAFQNFEKAFLFGWFGAGCKTAVPLSADG